MNIDRSIYINEGKDKERRRRRKRKRKKKKKRILFSVTAG
jgi:hypothetical protein